jgi:hypothetical protein
LHCAECCMGRHHYTACMLCPALCLRRGGALHKPHAMAVSDCTVASTTTVPLLRKCLARAYVSRPRNHSTLVVTRAGMISGPDPYKAQNLASSGPKLAGG